MRYKPGLSLAIIAAGLLSGFAPATAQAQSARDAAFAATLADPTNVEFMLRYARLSVEERDYEAAISTLERLLDIDPEFQEARLELALAYFALGANEVALYHLEIYRTRGTLTPEDARAVDSYAKSAQRRTRRLSFSGLAEAGVFYQTDSDNTGLSYFLGLRAVYDPETASSLTWDTTLRLTGFSIPDNSQENQTVLVLRTGPQISLDGTAFGPRLKPFVEAQLIEDDDDGSAGTSLSFGVEYATLLESGLSIDGELQFGMIDRDGFGIDSDFFAARVGFSGQVTPSTTVGVSLRYLDEAFDTGGFDRTRTGIRIGARHVFASDFLGLQNWSVSGYLRYEVEDIESARKDDLASAGVSVRTYFRTNSYVNASVRLFDRSSSDPSFDKSDTLFSIEAGMEF